jgi:hypothetical protein
MAGEHMAGTQFTHFWKNPETGEHEGVTEEVYNANKAKLRGENQRAVERGDKWFKGEGS